MGHMYVEYIMTCSQIPLSVVSYIHGHSDLYCPEGMPPVLQQEEEAGYDVS